jgi:hypothetical protein
MTDAPTAACAYARNNFPLLLLLLLLREELRRRDTRLMARRRGRGAAGGREEPFAGFLRRIGKMDRKSRFGKAGEILSRAGA